MSRQIRIGAFETNSSSSHSLVVSPGEVTKELLPKKVLRAGVLNVGKAEFGWEWRRLYSLQNKLEYLLTQLTATEEYGSPLPSDYEEEATAEIREKYPQVDRIFRMVEEHIGGGFKVLVIPGSSGYVDHQSQLSEFSQLQEVLENEDQLRQLLFNPESYIETGNDNSGPGKVIETDRGREQYYQRFYAKVPELARQMTFKLHHWWRGDIEVRKGLVLSEESNPELFNEVVRQAVVTKVQWNAYGKYNPFQYRDEDTSEGSVLQALARLGIRMIPSIKVDTHYFGESKPAPSESDELMSLTVKVPPELADKLRQFKVKPTATPATEG